ncbi:MAG: AMP-binding protein [Spirochaetaceae bacterium]|jgi:uncharacterized membrane protein/acyl-CoA synthetase (AMP-forming)/AMP-acid ligase II/3-hydroxymyristoyl/3-hydroxydecanoyl-(acyl carrier protein) dehydratase|nr:AMP-binding protein [Spirochaetaceae bacterium]
MTRKVLNVIFYLVISAYPVLAALCLIVLKVPPRLFSLFIVIAAAAYLLSFYNNRRAGHQKKTRALRAIALSTVLSALAIVCFISNSDFFLKLYPVIINAAMFFCFAGTFFFPPVIIFRLARIQDKTIKNSLAEKQIERYCKKVTAAWCLFFVLNGATALYTVFWGNDTMWAVYNGGISYILMGIMFMGEWLIRKTVDKKMPHFLSGITARSRPREFVVCYAETWEAREYKTWGDFIDETAALRSVIQKNTAQDYLLHCEDAWYFLTAFTALLQLKKNVLITANVSPSYIEEIRSGQTAFLTDRHIENSIYIPEIKADNSGGGCIDFPAINAEETTIILYTSGTTGKPKAVPQRLTEFELDNKFIFSKWGDEILKRKFVSTVSHHHIYGLLFSVLLPFNCGVPFRRKRIEFPEEFEKFTDTSYMIVTVPAFLKRAVEVKIDEVLHLNDPWIWSSGGVLTFETAKKVNELFNFWPLEVYGSTETSGIAYRQSKNGLAWTPFDDAHISKNEDGCLVVRSPYIKNLEGFTTGDLVDICDDGRFLLNGRADSIVKIEEKRISLTEIESRLIQCGLVSDACAVAMTAAGSGRQFLAAAVVFNDAGKEKFNGMEKHLINKWFREYLSRFFELALIPKRWRYLDALPLDIQGKKKKAEIEKLFNTEKNGAGEEAIHGVLVKSIKKQSPDSVFLELFVPASSDYFDGHFPDFKLLPALAQFELVMRLSNRFLGTGLNVLTAKRIKFIAPILPDSNVLMEVKLNPEQNSISYKISAPQGETIYSKGVILIGGGGGEP